MIDEFWQKSRAGSHAGRGFHYQDAVATELLVRGWRGELSLRRLVPEGLEDISLELDDGWLHVQAKSRREYRGEFTAGELADAWRHLAERLAGAPKARGAVALERPLTGTEDGLNRTLAHAPSTIRKTIASALGDVIDPNEFFARTHVLFMPSPEDVAIELLAASLNRPFASCVAHQAVLRGRLAKLADENGQRNADNAAEVTLAEAARWLDELDEAIDPSALDEAVKEGIAEVINFTTPLPEPRFYSGVDVLPGHVVAGLPLPRPELGELVDGLLNRRFALAVGPSGAGKSALIWLAAHATRHDIRWYRVRRLQEQDVPALVRLVDALSPRSASVGFAVDDLGREDRAGYDWLIDELRERPAAYVLAACREEDLFVLRSARTSVQVRPQLAPDLAERIWRELHGDGEIQLAQWREAYETSKGLLLEYGHLLTQGTRLRDTIATQIARRIRENRALELKVLTLVATADAFGADIDASRLAGALSVDSTEMKGALARLIDEHLISERDGSLGGLHELRSHYITEEIHHVPPPVLAETISEVIGLIDVQAIQPFVIRLLLSGATTDNVVVTALVARLDEDPDPVALAGALQALRWVAFRRLAEKWRLVLDEERIGPSHVATLARLTIQGGESDVFPEPMKRAIRRMQEIHPVDLRAPLLEQLASALVAALASCVDVRRAAAVLAALSETGVSVLLKAEALAGLAATSSLTDLRLLLEAGYAFRPSFAIELTQSLGGPDLLLKRVEQEQPWIRDAHIGSDSERRITVEAQYAFVAESAQPDPQEAVAELSRNLAAFAPQAAVVICRAVDARKQTAGFRDVPIADKRIERPNLPNPVQVAWNRARIRACIAATAAASETDYLIAARELIVQSRQVLGGAVESWARGKPLSRRLASETRTLFSAADGLAPRPIAIETTEPLDEGELRVLNAPSFLASQIVATLIPALFEDEATTGLISGLLDQIDELADPKYWRLLDVAPMAELAALRELLVDLRAVIAGNTRDVAIRASGSQRLSIAARVARDRTIRNLEKRARGLEAEFAKKGRVAHIVWREGRAATDHWSDLELLVLTEVNTIFEWYDCIHEFADLVKSAFSNSVVEFLMAPIRDGRIVASAGCHVIREIFPSASVGGWDELPFALLTEQLGNYARSVILGLHEASGIVASLSPSHDGHPEEWATLDASITRARAGLEQIGLLDRRGGECLLDEVCSILRTLVARVEDEVIAFRDGRANKQTVAGSMMAGIEGIADEIFLSQAGVTAACVEWDVNPAEAWDRIHTATRMPDG